MESVNKAGVDSFVALDLLPAMMA